MTITPDGRAPSPEFPGLWDVFNSGANVASGLTFAEAADYMTPERIERGWTLVCVINGQDAFDAALATIPTPEAATPTRKPLSHDQRSEILRAGGFADGQYAHKLIVATERAHGITGDAQ